MTNREYIAQMSDEELADEIFYKLVGANLCKVCAFDKEYDKCRSLLCRKGIAEWLSKERKTENG